MPGQLIIENHGPLVLSSNFWDLPECKLGKVLVSVNAGAFRILLPPVQESAIPDMAAAKGCAVSRGPWPASRLTDAIEILFDDGTNDPFAFHTAPEAFDRLPLDADAAGEWILSVWTTPRRGKPRKALERPCRYRRSPKLPDLRPWKD